MIENSNTTQKNTKKEEIQNQIVELLKKVSELKSQLGEMEEEELEVESELEISLPEEKKYTEEELKSIESQLKSFLPVPKEEIKRISSIIEINHMEIPNTKLILVLNQMPENLNTDEIMKWFAGLNIETLQDVATLKDIYMQKIQETGIPTIEGMTLSSTILTEDNTIVTNLGKVPIYKYTNGEIENIDELSQKELSSIIIPTNDYQTIMMYTDGEKESIEDDKIKVINSKTNRDELALELLESYEKEQPIAKEK